jgi:hypothetical protein
MIKNKIKKTISIFLKIFFIFYFLFFNTTTPFSINNKEGIKKIEASTTPTVGSFAPLTNATYGLNTDPSFPQTDPRTNDLMIAAISIRPSTVTLATPSGWTLLGSWTGTDGAAEGADTGSVVQYFFSKVSDGTEGRSNQTFTKTGTISAWAGIMMQYMSATGTYDVTAGGYSINGDATSWSTTLDTDIGLTVGDAVLIATSQNGNVANSASQNITATGISTKSTVREFGEYGSNNGNDIEMSLSDTLIWSGTNTVTPTVSVTMSAATSGAVTAIRIRQGSGTNRADTWVRSSGAQVGGSTSVVLPYPSHSIGDMLIAMIISKTSTGTPVTPANWTAIAPSKYTGGTVTEGIDSGTMFVQAYYREATSLLTGTQTFSITSGNSSIGQIISIHKDEVESWTIDYDGGSEDTPANTWSATGSGIDLSDEQGGDILLIASGSNTDAYAYDSASVSATGITFGETTITGQSINATNNDSGGVISTSRVVSGSGTVAPTYTMTSGFTANSPAGASMFIKIIGNKKAYEQSAYRFFGNDNSTDVGTALASQDTPGTLSSAGQAFRLRKLIHVNYADLAISGENFKLQFAEKSGTCDTSFTGETYADVTGATAISFNNNATPADGDNLTSNANDPTHGGDTIVNQDYEESNNFTNSVAAINSGQDGKWDFSLIDNSAPANTSYCFRVVKSDDSLLDTYTVIPEITTAGGGALSVDIVDAGGVTVGSPSVSMSPASFSFTNQTATGTFGTSSQKVRVDNGTGTATWTLSIAADAGATAFWDGAAADYDFNDPTASAGDGGDADSLGGQMTIDPSSATITPEGGCTLTNISAGSSSAFNQGVTDSITLASAASGADTNCYWDITDIDISQTIPAEQPAGSDYDINMTLSIIAS